jgi:hypothetical protein
MTRFYAVLERQQRKGRGKAPRHPDDLYVLVKDGFSWPAFFFGPLWALSHRMWVVGALLIAALIAIGMVPAVMSDAGDAIASWLSLSLAVLLGFHGNDLRQWSLERSGYELSAIVSGFDLTDAERRLFASMGSLMFGR